MSSNFVDPYPMDIWNPVNGGFGAASRAPKQLFVACVQGADEAAGSEGDEGHAERVKSARNVLQMFKRHLPERRRRSGKPRKCDQLVGPRPQKLKGCKQKEGTFEGSLRAAAVTKWVCSEKKKLSDDILHLETAKWNRELPEASQALEREIFMLHQGYHSNLHLCEHNEGLYSQLYDWNDGHVDLCACKYVSGFNCLSEPFSGLQRYVFFQISAEGLYLLNEDGSMHLFFKSVLIH